MAIVDASASDAESGFTAEGAIDGNRFAIGAGRLWKGLPGEKNWQWTADFGAAASIGAILQILGDHTEAVGATPFTYAWEVSDDGLNWSALESTRMADDRRMYRIHRLPRSVTARYLRLNFSSDENEPPAIREIEVYAAPNAPIEFPDWFLAINSYDVPSVESCDQFLALARRCKGWEHITAQFLWHGYLSEEIAKAEPRPLCLFFTGSFAEWCQVNPATWQATGRLLQDGSVPMWAACGGAQVFGILADAENKTAWDCPKCRDASHPKSAIYGHIGAIDGAKVAKCGDYTNSVFESGPTPVRLVRQDPVFQGLSDEFVVPENHCGQLEYLPAGWDLMVTKGKGGKTWMQCMKKRGACIYAAQFHIEIDGAPENSRLIMSNFLAHAKEWSASQSMRKGVVSP